MPRISLTEKIGTKPRREPDLTSLINIVFLILIFFIVAGSLRPFSVRDLKLAKVTREATGSAAASALIADADGHITYAGRRITLEELSALVSRLSGDAAARPFTIVADGRLPGARLLAISRSLKGAGVASVAVMVEKARP